MPLAQADGYFAFAIRGLLLLLTTLLDRQVVFFGGKGGVGKTTCSSAFALAASQRGQRVLLVSTDPQHSTSHIFDRPIGATECQLAPNLSGMEIDGATEAKRYIDGVKQNVHRLVSPEFVSTAQKQIDLSATSPGFIEMALLDRIVDLVVERGSVFDLIVFDTAPTGHTLQLLRTPKDMTKLVDGLITARRNIVEIDRGSEQSAKEAEEADPVLSVLTRRRERLRRLSGTLLDHSRTAFVLVTIPEHLPIEETADAVRLLEDIGVHVGGLVVNQVEPDVPDGGGEELACSREVQDYLDRRRSLKTQEQAYLDEIERRFAKLPRVRVHKQGHEVYGLGALEVVGREILG